MEAQYRYLVKNLHDLWFRLCCMCLIINLLSAQTQYPNQTIEYLGECSFGSNITCLCDQTIVRCNAVVPPLMAVPTFALTEVTHLDLNNNEIIRIHWDDFAGMEFLNTICLGNNSISYIHPHAFQNLYRLEVLYLADNQLADLDPFGQTFQHLASMRWLYLQNNLITKVSKYAFLTLGTASSEVYVDLDQNPVQCGCDIWALRNWEESTDQRLSIVMQCANAQNISYKNASDSVFGACNSTQEDIVNTVSECNICQKERTNKKCNLQGVMRCFSTDMVCMKSVEWYSPDRIMEITSKCVNYKACLEMEANNNQTCGLDYQSDGKIACNFCCKDHTCVNNSTGERTRDFTFSLSYIRNTSLNIQPVTELEQQTIAGIRSSFSSIAGGVDVTVHTFISQPQNLQQYKVVLQLHLTTFSNETEELVKTAVNNDLLQSTSPRGFLYTEGVVSFALSSYFEGMECNMSTDICPTSMNCHYSINNTTRCLCNESSFFNPLVNTCLSLSELQVANLTASTTRNKVILTWSAERYGTHVSYIIEPSPNHGSAGGIYVGDRSASWIGLDSGTQYNFTVISILQNDFYSKTTNYSLNGVWTKAVHENRCDPNASTNGNTCANANLQCIFVNATGNICLCSTGYYFSVSGHCRTVNELEVSNLRASSITNDTVALIWRAQILESNVSYIIEPSPKRGQIVENSLTDSGAEWSGLDPGTEYNFTVISVLPENSLYAGINVSASITGIWTKLEFGMECNISSDNCPTNMMCTQSLDNKTRCLCYFQYFYVPSIKTCFYDIALKVKNLSELSSTDNTVHLNWTAKKYGNIVNYTIQPWPLHGYVVANSVSELGGQWAGLYPGTQYTFTVTSLLTHDFYIKNIISSISGVWTKAVHGNYCSTDALVTGNICSSYEDLLCRNDSNGLPRCLCPNGFYFSPNLTCRIVNELLVKNFTAASSTTDTVTFTWTVQNYGANVSYTIIPSPNRGHLVENSFTESGAKWVGLDPGTKYNFTASTILPADDFYNERYVKSFLTGVSTKETQNVTIFMSYIRQNAIYQHFMNDSSSPEYMEEEQRIATGVESAISFVVDVIYIQVEQFRLIQNQRYIVLLQINVTNVDTETMEKVINEAIQSNTKDPHGFFFKEQLKSLEVFSNITGSNTCPTSVTSSEKGTIMWEAAGQGLSNVPCPYYYPQDLLVPLAIRECLVDTDDFARWGEVNDSFCFTKDQLANPDIEHIFGQNITAEEARNVSSKLMEYTERQVANFTVTMMKQTMQLLEQLVTEEMLAQPGVATNVMSCANNLFNVSKETLQQSEMENETSTRLLSVIDSVSKNTPLKGDQLKLSTFNVAVAAHALNDSKEVQDIIFAADTDSRKKIKDTMINISFHPGHRPPPKDTSSIVIPVKALLASLSPENQRKLERISFTVHRSDILFDTIKNHDKKPPKNTVSDTLGESHNDRSEQSQNFTNKINSIVISASVLDVQIRNLDQNVTMTFDHINTNATNASCVFWDESIYNGKGDWSSEGCGIVESNAKATTCGCNHLTNFALLMDVYDGGSNLSDLDRQILSIISYVGCALSVCALILTLLTYIFFRTLRRDNPSKILINLCLALLFSNLVFLVGMQDYSFENIASCKAVAVLLHYFLLASMTWMAVEAFYMYLALVIVFKTYFTNFILKCCLVGWGVPLIIVVINLAVNSTDNYGYLNSGLCWLTNPSFYAAFVGPVCFILLINCLAFILVIKQLVGLSSTKLHKTDKNNLVQRLRGAIGVVILLGLSWLFAIFAIDQASLAFYYLFAIFNSLQGLFIFIFYCLLKRDALTSIKRSLPCFEEYGDSSKSYTNNSRGITGRSTGHHLTHHKSGPSKYSGSTDSTNVDSSRKDSCFSTLSNSNTFDGTENGPLDHTDDTNMQMTSASRLPLIRSAVKNDLSSVTSPESDNLNRDFNTTIHDLQTKDSDKNTNPGSQHSRGSEYESDNARLSVSSIGTLTADTPSSQLVLTSLSNPETFINHDKPETFINHCEEQLELPHSSSVKVRTESDIPAYSHQINGGLNPSFTAEGEIDYSHTGNVSDIRQKYESQVSNTSNINKNKSKIMNNYNLY